MKTKWATSLAAMVGLAMLLSVGPAAGVPPPTYNDIVTAILAEQYQPNYVAAGFDSSFPVEAAPGNTTPVPNTLPAQDYTTGSVPGNPDHPNWPLAFRYVTKLDGLVSADGAPLRGRLALHPGSHPGVVVVHGFNTRAKESVIRWAAMLYANGYSVLAADARDFRDEWDNGEGWKDPAVPANLPNAWYQTFGWKEAQDVLAAGQFLKAQPGVIGRLGIVGVSLGGQDTVLAMALDSGAEIFGAGLNYSGPADQNAQIYSTAVPPGCQPSLNECDYPATDALIALVVPPYTQQQGKYADPCDVLVDTVPKYGLSPAAILGQEKAYLKQLQISVPLLSFYSRDDSLVDQFHATMMAGYQGASGLRRTFLVDRGEHAYFFDRWWQQRAMLLYFKALLPEAWADATVATAPTVNQTPGGASFQSQSNEVQATQADADALQKPIVCPGGTTAVSLTSLRANRSGRGVVVRWRTANEAKVLGYHVLREQGVRRVQVNRALIPARGDTTGASYSFRHRRPADTARYWIQEVRLDGTRALRGPVRVRG